MQISELRIKNLRLFRDQTVDFGDYTCLVGPNGAGKSTVLTALNIFFREAADLSTNVLSLDREDFYNKDVSEPIEITLTFEGLSLEAETDFADYFRQGKLIITVTAEWDETTKTSRITQHGQRLAMKAFAPFFEALGDGALVAPLREKYAQIKQTFLDLPEVNTKPAMTDALRNYEGEHPELRELLPSPDEFYGFSRGKNRLEKYVQWVFVPAVKDAATEQMESKKTALGLLLDRTVRAKVSFDEPLQKIRQDAVDSYQELLAQNEGILTSISETLGTRLQEWSHPEASCRLRWHSDPLKSVTVADPLAELLASEGTFEGAIGKFGHGLQRSLLLTLLHELANAKDQGPKLILGCEEPELYQHPPQARHLASVMQKLSTQNSQIIITTHSPLYVRGEHFQDVRLVRRDPLNKCATVQCVLLDKLAQRIAEARGDAAVNPVGMQLKVSQQLQPVLNEMFFTNVLVLVEGEEDVAYVTAYMHLTKRFEDFRRLGIHIVPTSNKTNMIRPLAIARALGIKTFVLFDSDADKPDKNGSCAKHEKDNKTLLALCGLKDADPLPANTLWADGVVMWSSDIGDIARTDYGAADWLALQDRVRNKYDIRVGDIDKNTVFIGLLLNEAWDEGKRFVQLDKLCQSILNFAAQTNAKNETPPSGQGQEEAVATN